MSQTNKPFATLDDINAIVLVADATGSIVFANKAIEHILGYSPEEVLGDGWWELTSVMESPVQRKANTKAMLSGKINLSDRHLFQSLLATKTGNLVWTQWTNTITSNGFLLGIAQDITEKKTLEVELIRKNQENELLLKEIHHRVKNNLQVISSFLNLQFSGIGGENVQDAVMKSKDRINSMALIHTKLFQSKNLATLEFSDYLYELVKSITRSYSTKSEIKCVVLPSHASFDIDLSINLGLIITELLTNAYKHAFVGKNKGLIRIELIDEGQDRYKLIIADDGVGPNGKGENSKSLGLEIVSALVDQIDGKMDVCSNVGLSYTITFSKN